MTDKASFHIRFRDKIGSIGKDGVIGLVQNTDNSISPQKLINPNVFKEEEIVKLKSVSSSSILNSKEKQINKIPKPPKLSSKNNNSSTNSTPLKEFTDNSISAPSFNNNINPHNFSQFPYQYMHGLPLQHPAFYIPNNIGASQNNSYSPSQVLPSNSMIYLNPNLVIIPQQVYNPFNNNFQQIYNGYSQLNPQNSQQPSEALKQNKRKIESVKPNNRNKKYINGEALPMLHNVSFGAETKNTSNNKRAHSSKPVISNTNSKPIYTELVTEPPIGINKNDNSPLTRNLNVKDNVSRIQTYNPYTIKEYKEMCNVKINMGGLGPNIGTRDWEERMKKMKKISEYSNIIQKTNKIVLKPLRRSPIEEIKLDRIDCAEKSKKNKAKIYDQKLKIQKKLEGSPTNKLLNDLGKPNLRIWEEGFDFSIANDKSDFKDHSSFKEENLFKISNSKSQNPKVKSKEKLFKIKEEFLNSGI